MTNQEKRDYWQAHVEAWRCSKLTQMAYCRQQGLVSKQFAYRVTKDHRRQAANECGGGVMMRVPVQIQEARPVGLVLQNAGGWQRQLPPAVSADWRVGLLRGLS